jgi:multiple sugar transport system ATP-binding protein
VAAVRFSHVDKTYGDGTHAVEDVNLDITDGEFIVFVGPSGCGKTTALRMLAGLETVSGGDILLGATRINDVSPRNRDVAMVFQNYALYPHMTVYDNMAFGLRARKSSRTATRARVEEIAKALDLEPLLDRRPSQLSGGQRQRVAMGRAIVRAPQVFLMDEPLSNLDAKLRVQMRAEIARIQKRLGTTTIYVTHDQVEAMTMGDRVALMRRGKLQQVAAPQEIYSRPDNLFVASFVGSPAMNFVRATVVRGAAGLTVTFGETHLPAPPTNPALEAYAGREVALGIRPEDIHLANGGAATELRFRGFVVLREALGSKALVHVDVAGKSVTSDDVLEGLADVADLSDVAALRGSGTAQFTAELEPDVEASSGKTLELEADLRHLHFFDLATGAAIRSA